jgi:hypothetical protein
LIVVDDGGLLIILDDPIMTGVTLLLGSLKKLSNSPLFRGELFESRWKIQCIMRTVHSLDYSTGWQKA